MPVDTPLRQGYPEELPADIESTCALRCWCGVAAFMVHSIETECKSLNNTALLSYGPFGVWSVVTLGSPPLSRKPLVSENHPDIFVHPNIILIIFYPSAAAAAAT